MKSNSANFIYFIANDELRAMKIGKARNIDQRLADLQSGSPHKLRVEYALRADGAAERWFHYRFEDRRISGEWFAFDECVFDLGDDDLDYRSRSGIEEEAALSACQAAFIALTMGRPWDDAYAAYRTLVRHRLKRSLTLPLTAGGRA